jgi:hypothetical protein
MMGQSARLLARIGLGMMVLSLLLRLPSVSKANAAGDDLAIAVSISCVVLGSAFSRFTRG